MAKSHTSSANLVTATELARRWGVSRQRVAVWVSEGRIIPALDAGVIRLFAADTSRPEPIVPQSRRAKKAEK